MVCGMSCVRDGNPTASLPTVEVQMSVMVWEVKQRLPQAVSPKEGICFHSAPRPPPPHLAPGRPMVDGTEAAAAAAAP